jgi:transcriptional regulator with XRE-family HTH domain
MPRQNPPDLGAVLKFLRMARGWQQVELGKASGIPGSLLSDYEQGRKTLTRERLESLVTLLGYSTDQIDTTLAYLDIVRGSPGPLQGLDEESEKLRRSIEATALEAGRKMTQGVREMLTFLTSAAQVLEARQDARNLWARLRRHPPEQRPKLVEDLQIFKDWALCERVAAESITAAPNHPRLFG